MSIIKDSPIFATANNATVTITNATNVSVLASGGSVTIRTADLVTNTISLTDGSALTMTAEAGNVIADLEIISASGSINGYITYFK